MKIQTQDFYHGAALTQIVEHESFKALNKGSARYGHYLINADCHLFIRYSANDNSPWSFTLTSEQLQGISNIAESQASLFIGLVCGETTICLLSQDQLSQLIDIASADSQWIKVDSPPNSSCRVSGSTGRLKNVIAHNAFPKSLFE